VPSKLIDIEYDLTGYTSERSGRRILVGVLVGMFIVVPLGVIAIAAIVQLSVLHRLYFGGASIAILVAALAWRSRSRSRKLDTALHALSETQPESWLLDTLRGRTRYPLDQIFPRFVASLMLLDRPGLTFRVASRKQLAPIDPINVQFEPRALDETDDTLESLVDAIDSSTAANDSPHDGHPVARAERRAMKKISTRIRKAGGWVALLFGCLFFIRAMMRWIRFGSFDFGLVFWLVIMAGWFLRLSGTSILSRTEWFLVPAGVAVRTLVRGARAWNVELFHRASSVLCVYRGDRNLWTALIANSGNFCACACTQREATVLLRAWLSPLDPPTLDKLTDLQ